MKKAVKIVLIIIGICVAAVLLLFCAVIYIFNYAVDTADQSESPDGKYTLLLQSVGSPVFFSSADGRLVLKEGREKISQCDFILSDDGGSIRPDIWEVTWEDQQVVVVISGSEQSDERITIHFNGETSTEFLPDAEITEEPLHPDADDGVLNGNSGNNSNIEDGYKDIYEQIFQEQRDSFVEEYDAKGNLRLVLHEDDQTIEYLMYDRESDNGKCGLYVYYSCQKQTDGSWSPLDAEILDIYAWVYDTGEVISSGRTGWADTGSAEYREVTGE